MTKNWVLFFAIFLLAYGGMFYLQFNRDAAYRKERAVYDAKLATWQQAQDSARQAKEAALAELRRASTPVPTPEASTTPVATTPDGAPLSAIPSLSNVDDQRASLSNPLMDDVKRIQIETPLYRVIISELGAVPISWEIKSSEYVRNLRTRPDGTPVRTSSGAIMTTIEMIPSGAGDPDTREFPLQFAGSTAIDFNKTFFTPTEVKTANGRTITFRGERDGMEAVKVFTFSDTSYVVGLTATITNKADARRKLGRDEGWGIGWQGGLGTPDIADRLHGTVNVVAAVGDEVRTRTIARDGEGLNIPTPVVWGGLEKKFFTALLVPGVSTNPPSSLNAIFNHRNDSIDYKSSGANVPPSVVILHPGVELEKDQSAKLSYSLYVGPKSREALRAADLPPEVKGANPVEVVFHSMPLGFTWVRPLTIWLLSLMRWLHETIAPLAGPGAWGLAIIATTLCVRTLIYPLTHWNVKAQVRTMMEQQRIRPDLEIINKKYEKDPVERNKAVMQLYRDHNINPLGVLRGCVPALLQMPIFLALYVVFEQSVELRAQPFLWIVDLSGPDALVAWTANVPLLGHSFNVLPVVMAATNFYLMKLMQQPAQDKLQQQIQSQMMFMMPIMFLFFLYHLPSGLILYWIVSNSISILQNYVTKKILAKEMARHEADKAAGLLAPPKPVTKALSSAKA